eukprot:18827-Heterococcus_DN1.PRE.2
MAKVESPPTTKSVHQNICESCSHGCASQISINTAVIANANSGSSEWVSCGDHNRDSAYDTRSRASSLNKYSMKRQYGYRGLHASAHSIERTTITAQRSCYSYGAYRGVIDNSGCSSGIHTVCTSLSSTALAVTHNSTQHRGVVCTVHTHYCTSERQFVKHITEP